ncbi:hypothetical protein IT881_08755 [Erythrobacter sp. A30-3]|nr:hypothetical protein IT881_08755 [Erythrobacter sp. A30-3]
MAVSCFVKPVPLTVASAGSQATNGPTVNLLNDLPDMVWRSDGVTTSDIVLTVPAGTVVDCFALLYSNLRSTDLVRVRAANSVTATTNAPLYDSRNQPAFSGEKSDVFKTKTIIFPPDVTATHWRITVTANNHPDGFIQASRVVIGKSVNTTHDMDYSCKQFSRNQSIVTEGAGWEAVEHYDALPGWTAKFSYIPMEVWDKTFFPFLHSVSNSKPVLFVPVPDEPETWQHEVVFGRLKAEPGGDCDHYDGWRTELTIVGIAS